MKAESSRERLLGRAGGVATVLAWGLIAASCASAPGDGLGASFGGVPLGGSGAGQAASAAVSLPSAPGRCPEDAPWNGRVCLGHGYVACPGASRLDDGGACATETLDAGSGPVSAPPAHLARDQ